MLWNGGKMRAFAITTDSNSDLPKEYLEQNEITVISHYYDIDGTVYGEDNVLPDHEFYEKMREGKLPTTMASNPDVILKTFHKLVEEGKDVLHISFSSALSGGFSNVSVGAREVCEENPNAKIVVWDTLSVSLGEGLFVKKAVELREQGKSLEETVAWLEEHRDKVSVQFTVDDLFHLHRGGRLSKSAAVLGTLVNIKPILHVTEEGGLAALAKARGRKKSIQTLVDNMAEKVGSVDQTKETVCIVHGDCLEDALLLQEKIKERFAPKEIIVNTIGPSIGAHSGPNALGLIFMCDKK